jgi:ribonuclease P protein subunit POP4
MQTPLNIIHHELIGLKAEVVKSSRASDVGIGGEIVDETQQTIKIKAGEKTKIVPKEGLVFRISLPKSAVVEIDGLLLAGRPQERVKNKQRIRFT